jgi:formiminoglutamase
MNSPKEDALWPRASAWLKPVELDAGAANLSNYDLGLMGIPAHLTSISATNAHTTPAAIRAALQRYSTYNWTTETDVAKLSFADFGDVLDPDSEAGEARTSQLASDVSARAGLAIGLGGDNSITFAMARGVFGAQVETSGLITLDAHHDLRDGISNGSPVRRLIDELGLDGRRIVQIGIADFSNSPEYAARARELGIHVIPRSALRDLKMTDVMAEAVSIAGSAGGPIHVDFDVDVCDRSVVPACPAAAPGGISADEFRQLAFEAGRYSQIRSVDFTEIDASIDAADGRTVRLAALGILELAAGRLAAS